MTRIDFTSAGQCPVESPEQIGASTPDNDVAGHTGVSRRTVLAAAAISAASVVIARGQAAAPAAAPTTAPAKPKLNRPLPVPVPNDPAVLTDDMVEASIRRGAEYLLKQFDAKTNWANGVSEKIKEDEAYAGGVQAIAVYALMQCGLALRGETAPTDPAAAKRHHDLLKELDTKGEGIGAKLDALMKMDLSKSHHGTYAHGLRSTALALFVTNLPDRTKDNADNPEQKRREIARRVLANDAAWCVMATPDGSYTYAKHPQSPKTAKDLLDYYTKIKQSGKLPLAKGGYDNSNCQYGLLGAWSAAEAEVEVPTLYWYLVANHWSNKQQKDGTWQYGEERALGNNPINMTAAGLASMLVTHEYIEPAIMSGAVGREPYNMPIKRGLNWFEQGNNAINVNGGYGFYGVERVGLASGFKFFGQHDWFKVIGTKIVKSQAGDGGWPGAGYGPVVGTAYYLLFLARGRHPILMNKLRFDGDGKTPGFWANRPRDAANLAKIISKRFERPLNWQVINISTPWEEWLDGPILTIGSHQPFNFSDAELEKIRSFVHAGGILYTQADGSDPKFDKFANQLAGKLFKQDLIPIPPTHPIYTSETLFKIQPPVPLKMVTNGSRIFMVHSSVDLAKSWQQRDDKGKGKPHFEVGMNLFLYAAGKGKLRNRLESLYVPAPKTGPVATFPIARVNYNGYWDPEPGAWKRFVNIFWRATGYKLDPVETKTVDLKPVDLAQPPSASNIRFAHMTGTIEKDFAPDQVKALTAYLESGGILLVDSVGGMNKFDASVQKLFKTAFPNGNLRNVPRSHPMMTASAPGMIDVGPRSVRTSVIEKNAGGQLQIMTVGKGAIVYSPLDITSGLLGTNTVGILGWEPDYSVAVLRNIILWAFDGAKDEAPAAAQANG